MTSYIITINALDGEQMVTSTTASDNLKEAIIEAVKQLYNSKISFYNPTEEEIKLAKEVRELLS